MMIRSQSEITPGPVPGRYAAWLCEQMKKNVPPMDQMELARRSGLKQETVSAIVRNATAKPSVFQVVGLLNAFGVTPNELFRGAGWWQPAIDNPDDMTGIEARVVLELRRFSLPVQLQILNLLQAFTWQTQQDSRPGE
jgi:transcriptional regulator with XRE-family HTH domain